MVLAIDPDFQKRRTKTGEQEGKAVWGPVELPKRLGIHGTNLAVDWDICEGHGICLEVCPVQLYEWRDTPEHPTSQRKSFPAREEECIQCLACEVQCPVQAIKITSPWVTSSSSPFAIAGPLLVSFILAGYFVRDDPWHRLSWLSTYTGSAL